MSPETLTVEKALANLSIAELEAELQKLDEERAKLKAMGFLVTAAINRKVAEAKVSKMSDAEKDALRQVLLVDGFAETEEIGTPGA